MTGVQTCALPICAEQTNPSVTAPRRGAVDTPSVAPNPNTQERVTKDGEILFRKGDKADHMYFVVAGRLHLHEIDIDLLPGSVVGELGMLAPARMRTQTLGCTENGSVLEISYDEIEELYYQNPTFGFYFLRLSSARLFENIGKLERTLAERDQEILRVRETIVP